MILWLLENPEKVEKMYLRGAGLHGKFPPTLSRSLTLFLPHETSILVNYICLSIWMIFLVYVHSLLLGLGLRMSSWPEKFPIFPTGLARWEGKKDELSRFSMIWDTNTWWFIGQMSTWGPGYHRQSWWRVNLRRVLLPCRKSWCLCW